MSEIKEGCIVCDKPNCDYWKDQHGQFALNSNRSKQRTIEELRAQLTEAREVIEWMVDVRPTLFADKARAFLAKYPKGGA